MQVQGSWCIQIVTTTDGYAAFPIIHHANAGARAQNLGFTSFFPSLTFTNGLYQRTKEEQMVAARVQPSGISEYFLIPAISGALALKNSNTSSAPISHQRKVMNEFVHGLGVSPRWAYTDVWGLDSDMLSMIPQPVLAVLLLFPITENYEKFREEEETHLKRHEQLISPKVVFFRQTIPNACGTIGLLHSLATHDDIVEDGPLKSLIEKAKPLSPDERAELLEQDTGLARAHHQSALDGQTHPLSLFWMSIGILLTRITQCAFHYLTAAKRGRGREPALHLFHPRGCPPVRVGWAQTVPHQPRQIHQSARGTSPSSLWFFYLLGVACPFQPLVSRLLVNPHLTRVSPIPGFRQGDSPVHEARPGKPAVYRRRAGPEPGRVMDGIGPDMCNT
ncbi:hypothetical protein BC936DRAFT_140575 [Jimgerdemannia flammicorona]|uniref:Ubiquitin carboxyl-terminal hydrolase n=1 Tax=Jimgerdemannia flammicorona TaxID=994334 RepID=A0A433AM21_9FUNG|nr:hypothetical protein BC936DRAFT_140575 [Jimgerdemannia flammicorona]